ncbi:hypothetical protein LTR05_005088 [Lithohypha guttulata]|uniref:Glycosyl hydrolase family 13 catalytic domain-containing protein n=1 Tax=Lithohypha guttulata TaxID=1690604 RepID=A0AAN7Y6D3_9EURO|nr:hypothetical protein LTR05_005088 [Lithohypha guttulata]
MANDPQPNWWKTGTAYQIWPASYKDSNGDGLGDIPGIVTTLDYLKNLGIDIIWLSPMYDSPQKDYGYDISNYQGIYPPFGTMNDMDTLIEECHNRGMRIILDLVINHTSDEHAWFKESRMNKTNPKADWYMWKDPRYVDGKRYPPTNWKSIFGGSAWEWVEERQQYYLHLFVKEQPDLNWELEEVRRAIYKEAIEFWLDKGVDGFRVDTCNLYSKDISFPEAAIALPEEEYQPAFKHFENGPRMHEWLQEQRRECLDKYGDILMVGECPASSIETILAYCSPDRNEFSCVFDFDVVDLGTNRTVGGKKHQSYKHQLPEFKQALAKCQNLIQDFGAWGTVFLENHDQARSVSRFATDKPEFREAAAKMLAVCITCLSGTLFIYQGQEIGSYNHSADWSIEDIRDIDSINAYNDVKNRYGNDPLWNKKSMRGLATVGRDNARLPVQWSAEANAGFTDPTATPWIRVHDDYKNVNIAEQLQREDSPLKFWQRMLKFRHEYQDLTILGDFELHDFYEQKTFIFVKKLKGAGKRGSSEKELLVCCSFSDEEEPLDMPGRFKSRSLELLVSNYGEANVGKYLKPWEARIYLVK